MMGHSAQRSECGQRPHLYNQKVSAAEKAKITLLPQFLLLRSHLEFEFKAPEYSNSLADPERPLATGDACKRAIRAKNRLHILPTVLCPIINSYNHACGRGSMDMAWHCARITCAQRTALELFSILYCPVS